MRKFFLAAGALAAVASLGFWGGVAHAGSGGEVSGIEYQATVAQWEHSDGCCGSEAAPPVPLPEWVPVVVPSHGYGCSVDCDGEISHPHPVPMPTPVIVEPSHGCSGECGGTSPNPTWPWPPSSGEPSHGCSSGCGGGSHGGGGEPSQPPVVVPITGGGCGVIQCCSTGCGGGSGGGVIGGGGGTVGPGGGGSTSTSTTPGGGGTGTTPTSTATSTVPSGGGGTVISGGGGGGGSVPTAEIAILKSIDNANPVVGSTIHYSVVVSALGPSASLGVAATDVLPFGLTFVSATTSQGTYTSGTGSWAIGQLNSGQKATLVITATVAANTLGMTIANTANVSESTNVVDQNLGNNSSTATLVVQGGTGGGTVIGGGGGGNTVTSGGGGGGNTVTSGGGGGGGGGGGTGGGGSPSGGQVLGASTSCGLYLNEYIHPLQQSLNDPQEVMKLQRFLNMNLGINLPVTGYYGPLTIAATDQFQTKYHTEVLAPWVPYGLATERTPTDYVYKTTKRWINMLMCPALNLPVPALP